MEMIGRDLVDIGQCADIDGLFGLDSYDRQP